MDIYSSCLILRPRKPHGPKYEAFVKSVERRQETVKLNREIWLNRPGNKSYEQVEDYNVDPTNEKFENVRKNLYMAYLYDSIMLYDKVMVQYLESNDTQILREMSKGGMTTMRGKDGFMSEYLSYCG